MNCLKQSFLLFVRNEIYAIEIKMRFLFTDYPDSIVADHWWDDSIWSKIGIV